MKHLLRIHLFLRPYLWQTVLNLSIMFVVTVLSLVVPRIIQGVIDDGLLQGQTAFLARSALVLLALGLISALLSLFQRYLSQWVASHIGYDLRNRLYDRMQYMPFSFHDHSQTGQLISRCIEDVRSIQDFLGGSLIDLVQLLLLGVGIIAIMLAANWKLALIALVPMVPLVWVASNFGRQLSVLFYAVDMALGDLSARLQENVSGAQVVRAFAREPYEIGRFDEMNKTYFNARVKSVEALEGPLYACAAARAADRMYP